MNALISPVYPNRTEKTAPQGAGPCRVVVLISGRGSNLSALLAHPLHRVLFEVVAVVSNKPTAAGLALARSNGVYTEVLEHTGFESRQAFDQALLERVLGLKPDLVVLAGYMRILTEAFVRALEGRMINVHPSLLPAFKGLKTHECALEAGVKLHGATVHFVTPDLDHGPIIAQAAVPVNPDDTPESLAARVLQQEHVILPAAVCMFAQGRLSIQSGRVSVLD